MSRLLCCGIAALVLSSCTPTAEQPATTVMPVSTSTSIPESQGVEAFLDCLAEHGIARDAVDETDVEALAVLVLSLPTDSLAACGLRAGDLGAAEKARPEVRVMVRRQLEAFAMCMRAEGVEDFPDPEGYSFPPDRIPYAAPGFFELSRVCTERVTTLDGE